MNDAGGAARRQLAIGAGLFLLSAVFRVAYVLEVSGDAAVRFPLLDSRAYHERALRILSGEWLGHDVFYQDPLYSYLLALLYGIFGVGSGGVLITQALIDSGTVVLIHAIARRVFDDRTALVAGGIAALYKVFFFYDALLLKSSISVFLITLALYACVRAEAVRRPAAFATAGFSLGIACLTRGNYLLFVPVWLAWLGLRRPFRSRIAPVGFAVLGLALAIAPITLRNRAVADEWVLITSQAGQNFYIGNHLDNDSGSYKRPAFLASTPFHEEEGFQDEAERRSGRAMGPGELSRFWFREAAGEIARDPGHFARHLARKAQLLVNHAEVPDNVSYAFFRENVSRILRLPLPTWGAVLPLALWGVFAARHQRRATPLLLFLSAYATSVLLFYNTSRYRIPAAPAVIVFAAAGVWQIVNAVRDRQRGVYLATALWLALAWSVAYSPAYDEDFARHRVNVGRRHQDRAAFQESLARMYARTGNQVAAAEARDRAHDLNAQAEQELRLALLESPRSSEANEALTAQLVGRTRELLRGQRYEEARRSAADLTASFPTLPDGWILLGRAYEGLGQIDPAARAQRRARDLAPDDPRPREALDRLGER